jgi:hypothetical protein
MEGFIYMYQPLFSDNQQQPVLDVREIITGESWKTDDGLSRFLVVPVESLNQQKTPCTIR